MEEDNRYDGVTAGTDRDKENKPAETQPSAPVPPEIPEEIRTEKKWADTLGIEYDEEKVARDSEAPVPDEMPPVPSDAGGRKVPPMYVMPPEEELPPVQPEFREPMPPTFMVWAVISTVCCCLPVGVVAIFFAAQVSSKYYARDYEGSKKASERAEIWIIAAIVLGLVFNILYMPLSIISGVMTGAVGGI